MGRFYTYSWQHREMLRYPEGAPIGLAYGSQFARRGICPDDEVYMVSVRHGRVYVLGKMRVRAVTYSADDCRRWAGESLPLEPAAEYLLAAACTPARLVTLPEEMARSLRFLRSKQSVGLTFDEDGKVDRQSMRSVRQLCAVSAAALDALLPALEPFAPNREGDTPAPVD
jgi:hypothetical protein